MRLVKKCPACDSDNSETVASLNEENKVRFHEYAQLKYSGLISGWIDAFPPTILRCLSCGHVWYRDQPEKNQLQEMYELGKPLSLIADSIQEATSHMICEMTKLRNMVGYKGDHPQLLDFGSGSGRWSLAAVQSGFNVKAYEPSLNRSEIVSSKFSVVNSMTDLDGATFQAIQIEQVLEHLQDPFSTLLDLRNYSSAKTIIRITVPNLLRSAEGDKIWELWPFDGKSVHFLAPFEHLHGFTPTSLDRLIERSGFRSINSLREIKFSHMNYLRRLAGNWVPKLGSTLRYIVKVD